MKIIIPMIFLLTGCGSIGPMQSIWGPVNTHLFELIVLDSIDDGSEKVYFKELTEMHENGDYVESGVFFITDKGVYFGNWDNISYEYIIRYNISFEEIDYSYNKKLSDTFIWLNSNVLNIKDNDGNEVSFALKGRNAARQILKRLSKIEKK